MKFLSGANELFESKLVSQPLVWMADMEQREQLRGEFCAEVSKETEIQNSCLWKQLR